MLRDIVLTIFFTSIVLAPRAIDAYLSVRQADKAALATAAGA
jgi:hypothetical protein